MQEVMVNGVIHEFPLNMTQEEIKVILQKKYSPSKQEIPETELTGATYGRRGILGPTVSKISKPVGDVLLQNPLNDFKKLPFVMAKNAIEISHLGNDKLKNFSNEEKEKYYNKLTQGFLGITAPGYNLFNYSEDENVVDMKTGKIKNMDTAYGTAAQIGLSIVGAKKFIEPFKQLTKKLPAIRKSSMVSERTAELLGYTASSMLAFDVDDLNFIDVFDKEDRPEILNFLASNPDDTDAEKRLKVVLQNAGLEFVFGALLAAPSIFRGIKGKKIDEMTPEELEADILKHFKDAREDLNVKNNIPILETEEGLKQVKSQNESFFKRIKQQYFSSRGFSTPQIFRAASESRYSQKQLITASQNIANRLNIALQDITDISRREKVTLKVSELLETDLSNIFKLPIEKQVSTLARRRKIPEEVAEEVLKARTLIDQLSDKILKSKGFTDEAKEAINNNLGTYLRRSFRFFEDPNYIPTIAQQERLTKSIQRSFLSEGDEPLIALKKAEQEVNKLLKKKPNDLIDYINQVKRVGKFYQKNNNLSPEMKAFLGEIKNPSENIILSVTKAARIYNTNKYYQTVLQLGKGKYIKGEGGKDVGEGKVLSVRIKPGSTNVKNLDGKYTTPEIYKAIMRQEEQYSSLLEPDGALTEAYKFYIGAKGLTQNLNTVWSHVTHARNVIGAYQFGIANGIYLGPKETLKLFKGEVDPNAPMKVIMNQIRKTGKRVNKAALDDLYEEYLDLGLINTSVNVNQFREMLETGYEASSVARKAFSKTRIRKNYPAAFEQAGELLEAARKTKTGAAIEKGLKIPEAVYMGTDDFFKIKYYNYELAYLRKHLGDTVDDKILKQRAANIVKDTVPNYNKIPFGIKRMRDLPIGNFISFPAEIVRTSYNILKQSIDEINSTNSALKRRGQQRLAGFMVANIGYAGLAKMTADLYGMSEQEIEDRRILKSNVFTSGHNLMYVFDEGKYYTLNTQYLDSYNTLKEPMLAFYDQIREGKLKGKEFDEIYAKATGKALYSLIQPYVDESMITEATIGNLLYAANNPEGKNIDGKIIFPTNNTSFENTQAALTVMLKTFMPGFMKSGEKFVDAVTGEPNKFGDVRNPFYEGISQFGFKFDEFKEDDYLKYAAVEFNKNYKANLPQQRNLETTKPGDVVDDYLKVQNTNYKYFQNLALKVQAHSNISSTAKTFQILRDNGIGQNTAMELLLNQFNPTEPNLTGLPEDIFNKLPEDRKRKYIKQFKEDNLALQTLYLSFLQLPLEKPDGFEKEIEIKRQEISDKFNRTDMAKGGEVNVPNAPVEPDERINKLTGLPYTETAGPAFQDNEDEADPLRRLGFNKGGNFDWEYSLAKTLGFNPEDLEAVKNSDKRYPISQRFSSSRNKVAKGDMLRHFMLGVAASRSENPRVSLAAIQIREDAFRIIGDGDRRDIRQDKKNNDIGYSFYKNPKEITMDQALQDGMKLIEEGKLAIFE